MKGVQALRNLFFVVKILIIGAVTPHCNKLPLLILFYNNYRKFTYSIKKETMNPEVNKYIEKLPKWQADVFESLRKVITETIPGVGHYAAVIHAAKDKISFMIFNATDLQEIKGFFKSTSSPERKSATIMEGQEIDYKLLSDLLKQASSSL
jgi:hypothetical protein